MTAVDATATTTLWASASLAVAMRAQGAVLPRYGSEPDVPLDLAGLRLIESLTSTSGYPTDRPTTEPCESLLQALEVRGLLRERGPDASHAPARDDVPRSDDGHTGIADGEEVVLPTPLLLDCSPSGFEYVDHDGVVRVRLSAVEVLAALTFGLPTTVDAALVAQSAALGADALPESAFHELVGRLAVGGLLVPFDPTHPVHARQTRQSEAMREGMRRQGRVHEAFDRLEAEHDARASRTDRVKVVGFHTSWSGLPASLAMIIAAAKAHDGGKLEEHYDFRPRLFWDAGRLEQVTSGAPGIFLFSNYIWSSPINLEHSALVKERNPHHVTVHGGPNTPKYLGDVERYFAAHPHVDVAVHGEGEATFAHMLQALVGAVGDGPPNLAVLADVPGLSYRDGDRVVQTADRERIADLDSIPSPILTGLYDGFIPAGHSGAVIIETNRGCPYGCTFCDWGSATLSRVRKFDLDRLFAELEWCATHEFETIGIADANFGIFERDVDIAERIAELKATHGYPKFVGNNYAKNTVKHLSKIIEAFTDAGIVAEGKMSMQTFDEGTLATIHRKNIKVEKYYDLSGEFRRNQLPMMVDIMMGLPGSTPETFRNDLQQCINRAVRVAIHSTLLLTNSPMNEPAYREENGITAMPGEEVKETSTYTRADWERMDRLTWAYYVLENFGVLRQVATYVHAETGQREIDFYEALVADVHRDPEQWPLTRLSLQVLPELMVPPVSWKLFLDEVRAYLVDRVGIADDSALDTVLAVQHALLPARGRAFPFELTLPHDYQSWFTTLADLRDQGMFDDWHTALPPLRDFAPGRFVVDDPFDVCTTALGGSLRSLMVENAWDLESAVSRPRQRMTDESGVGITIQ
jgi:radical SAM superfamily enzyme YgiQ (UPF0313 family)